MTMMGWHDGAFGWGAWLAMSFAMLAFLALLVVGTLAIVHSIRRDERPPVPPEGPSSAEKLLDERFARGEVDEQEYRHRRELLQRRG
jgi:putative membrane protein